MNIKLNETSEDITIKRGDIEKSIFKNIYGYIVVNGTSVSKAISPGIHYIFKEVTDLTITFENIITKEVNEFSFEFDSGDVATNLSLPNNIGTENGNTLTIEANAHYIIKIHYSQDGRYFCNWIKYLGGGAYIIDDDAYIVSTSGTGSGAIITMSRNVTKDEIVDNFWISTPYGDVISQSDPTYDIKLAMRSGGQVGVLSYNNDIITLTSYSGPPITEFKWGY